MLKKYLPYVLWTCLACILLVGSGMVFLQSTPGERWVSKKVNQYVSEQYKTTFRAQIRYQIPDWLEFRNTYLADQNRDTLLAVQSLRLDLNVWDLLQKKITVDQILVDHGRIRLVDHNFDFLLPPPSDSDSASEPWPLAISKIRLKKVNILWKDPQLTASGWVGQLETGISIGPTHYQIAPIELKDTKIHVNLNESVDPPPVAAKKEESDLPDILLTRFHGHNVSWFITQAGNTGWKTSGSASRFQIRVKSMHIPSSQIELEHIQGDFPFLTWENQRLEAVKIDIPVVRYSPQKQYLWVRGLGLQHPNGLALQAGFKADNDSKSIRVSDFHAHTSESEIRWDGQIQSPNDQPWTSVSPEKWIFQFDNPVGKLAWIDLHAFIPTLLPDQMGLVRFSHSLRGDGKIVQLKKVQYEGPAGSRLHLNGQIQQKLDWEKISGDIRINEFSLPDARWHALVPKEIRNAYQLPGNIQLNGSLKGSGRSAQWEIQTVTSMGNLHSTGTYTPSQEFLKATVDWRHIAVGKVLKQDSLGPTSGKATIQVTQLLHKNRSVTFTSTLEEARYGAMELHDLKMAGSFQAPTFAATLQSDQPGFAFDVKTAGFFQDDIQIQGSGTLQDIDLKKWAAAPTNVHLTAPIAWSAHIPNGQFQQTTGYFQLDRARWEKEGEITRTQPMRLEIGREGLNQTLAIRTGFLDAQLVGNYSFDGVAREFTRFLNPYFHLQPDSTQAPISKEQFALKAELRPDPWLAFMSDHKIQFQPMPITGYFDSEEPEKTRLFWDLKQFQWDSLKIAHWRASIQPRGDSLRLDSEVEGIEQGSFRLNKASIAMAAAQDRLQMGVQVLDSIGQPIHRVGLQIQQQAAQYILSLDPSGWQIYYENFQTISGGQATFTADGMRFDSLGLRKGPQELLIHSAPQNPWQQWFVHARDISLKTWTATFLRDTTLVNGLLQADVTLLNPWEQPTYVGDVKIEDLAVFQIPLGTFEGHSTNRSDDEIAFDAILKGAGNEVTLQGTYATGEVLNPVKATLDIERLTAETLQTFSQGQLRDSKGFVQGSGKISGSFDQPNWEGELRFQAYQTTVSMTGTTLKIDNQRINAQNKTIYLENFQLRDTLQNILTLRGTIQQTPDQRLQYRVNAQTKDFLATNARRSDNAFFYGAAYLDADVQINGYDAQYQVRGSVRVADKTRLTAYMPADEQVGSELNQIVHFVSPISTPKSTETTARSEKIQSNFDPSTLSLNLSVSENAELTLIMDEMTGDYLKVRGNGQMTTGLDAQGDLFILGRFNVKEGIYRMTYQVFERQFVIDESSQSHITWRGNPTDADIQITASYKVNKPLATYPFTGKDLTKDPRLQRQVPLSVDLLLKGDLMAPQTSFALSMAKEYVDRQLGGDVSTLLEDEGFLLVEKDRLQGRVNNPKAEANAEKIKEQAIYMLMFGRFDILGKRLTTGLDAEGFARKQVSQLISDQLDRLASDIIKGVDLDVGVQSESGVDHTNRSTNLNLGVKKAFLNDRVSISIGKNFELESAQRQSNEIFDHLTANYNITRDGRYRFKAFRSNQYQIEGFVVETGVGFVLTLDYDDRREIFRRSLPKTQP